MSQNKRVNWDTCQIGIPGATAKDKENRRIPFNPKGRLAAILKRRSELGPDGYVFGSANGSHQPNIQTAWETLRLLANGVEPKPEGRAHGIGKSRTDDSDGTTAHERRVPLAADGVDIPIIQSMLGHAASETQRYLHVTRRGMGEGWR